MRSERFDLASECVLTRTLRNSQLFCARFLHSQRLLYVPPDARQCSLSHFRSSLSALLLPTCHAPCVDASLVTARPQQSSAQSSPTKSPKPTIKANLKLTRERPATTSLQLGL
ncbi:hypothetical protein Syun_014358 [Stephania yunnanensis]|uniref:Uncharacterized protein n=1 Tax=Stephania yunnanensis TaxID=152371 RepID=A0AAP0JJ66_9MAGN